MEKRDVLTLEQENEIVRIIMAQCERHKYREKEFKDLSYAPYAKMRKEHDITTSVLSGFIPTVEIPGISVEQLRYGLCDKEGNHLMAQPELRGERAILHICNSGCGFSSAPFKENCKRHNSDFETEPLYCCVVFYAESTGLLNKIEVTVPNAEGKLKNIFELYKRENKIIQIA